jgi:glutathione peroxidase
MIEKIEAATSEGEPLAIGAIALSRLDGTSDSTSSYLGSVLLIVNVASLCGRTPQYGALQALYHRYKDDGFTVLAFPCNQFGSEEPGSAAEIASFCTKTYSVTFPLFAKADVNGSQRHPLYEVLTKCADSDGEAGDIAWNFEKFLVARSGAVVRRYRDAVIPDAPEIVDTIKALL